MKAGFAVESGWFYIKENFDNREIPLFSLYIRLLQVVRHVQN